MIEWKERKPTKQHVSKFTVDEDRTSDQYDPFLLLLYRAV